MGNKKAYSAGTSLILFVILFLAVGCTRPVQEAPPTSTPIPLLDQTGATVERTVPILEATSTSIPTMVAVVAPTEAPPATSVPATAEAPVEPTPEAVSTVAEVITETVSEVPQESVTPAAPPVEPSEATTSTVALPLIMAEKAATPESTPMEEPTPTTEAAPMATPTVLAPIAPQEVELLPPVMLNSNPADGELWTGGAVVFTFDQELDAESAKAIQIDPALDGEVLVDGARLIFEPKASPELATRYHFVLDGEQIRSVDGVAMGGVLEITLPTLVPLQVTATQPTDGATDISPRSSIVVMFNQPVVPLSGLADQADLPNPLTIEPAVDGVGQWINTSVFSFEPAQGLAGATVYTVLVDGITALNGASLAEPVTFSFMTAQPTVVDSRPKGRSVRPDSQVVVRFNQAMDSASTEAAFSLEMVSGTTREALSGSFEWNDAKDTLTFTPDHMLEFGATYRVTVSADAQPASLQGHLLESYESSFQVVPLPGVERTDPKPGAVNVPPERGVTIWFTTNMSRTLVMDNITIEPPITSTSVYSFYSGYNNRLSINWTAQPQTTYTVTLGANMGDDYGNRLGKDFVLTFTTGDLAPFARLSLPQFTHFSAFTKTTVSLFYRNMDALDIGLYRISPSEFLRLTGENRWEVWRRYQLADPEETRVWEKHVEPDIPRNEIGDQAIELVDSEGNLLSPGIYMLQVKLPPSTDKDAPTHDRALIVLSNDNLVIKKSFQGESLAWQTDLRTGEPVPDQSIQFFEDRNQVGEATTDESGIAAASLELNEKRPWLGLVAISGQPGDEHFSAASTEWDEGIGPWEWEISYRSDVDAARLAFYTDRPIYRPGQQVHWKGIVRLLDNETYRLPPEGVPVHVLIRDDRGTVLFEQDVRVNEHGTISGDLVLAEEAPTGFYGLEAKMMLGSAQEIYGGVTFQVAEYRKPEFEIRVSTDQPEYIQGDTISVTVEARYFSGEPMANAPVDWSLLADNYVFRWEGAPKGRFFRFDPYVENEGNFNPFGGFYGGLLQQGSGKTGPDGVFVFEMPADLAESLTSQRWTFDVTVQSPTNQFVSGRTTVPVHRGQFYVGLSPQQYVGVAGEPLTVDVVTVTPQGEAYPKADLEVIVSDFKWNSVYEKSADGSYHWTTSVERTPVFTTSVTTDADGAGLFTWTPEEGGQYLITATGADEAGNQISSAAFVWIRSADRAAFVPWRRENNDRMELVRDKDLYEPGDTAKVLVPSPFTGPVYALITLERSGILERSVRVLESNSETLEIPITSEHIPNVYVSVILVKGVDETNPTPAIRVGYVLLPVDVSQKELNIDVQVAGSEGVVSSAETPRFKPGETISYTLTVTDYAGQPVANAELSAALIDKAVLSLTSSYDPPLVERFYFQAPLAVDTGALLIINQDRLNQQVPEGAKGGGGGGGPGFVEVRKEFADVAYWRADLTTDEQGQVTFSVTLPDNLTTWRLVLRAVTDDTLVGEAVHDALATKDLLIRPIAPRFFTSGDRAKIGAVIQNTTQQDLTDVAFSLETTGAVLVGAGEENRIFQGFDLPAGGQIRVDQLIEVDSLAESVVMTYTALGGDISDAARIAVPVVRYETPEVVGAAGTVPPEGRLEVIRVPEAATDNGELLVTVEPSLAAGMIDGLNYLTHFPYECTEQTVSRFLPNLFTVRALNRLNVNNPELETELAFQLGVGLQKLINFQNPDGGWGWWADTSSNVFISSYVLWGLWNADQEGYPVPDSVLRQGVDFLSRKFIAPSAATSSWRLNEMAFMHFVLAEMGEGDPGRASTLYDVRDRLGIYGQAYLAMALADMAAQNGVTDERVQNLLDNIAGRAHLTATGASWSEEQTDWQTMNTDTRTTSIVLAAFARLQPENPLLPNVVRWLMSARTARRWASTQENAWAIIALTDWMEATGELEANYNWRVTLNGEELGSGEANPDTLADRVQLKANIIDLLRDEANVLRLNRDNESGQLYYTTHLRYFLDATAIPAQDRGIVVNRTILAADGEHAGEPVTTAQVGDVLSVTVTIAVPTQLYYVALEVPIPAGTELVDVTLATTSSELGGPEFGTAEGGYSPYDWWYWIPTHTDLRDEKAALFADFLPAGTYEYTFLVRASLPGEFRVLPARAEEMYFPEVWGRSAGALFTVTE